MTDTMKSNFTAGFIYTNFISVIRGMGEKHNYKTHALKMHLENFKVGRQTPGVLWWEKHGDVLPRCMLHHSQYVFIHSFIYD